MRMGISKSFTSLQRKCNPAGAATTKDAPLKTLVARWIVADAISERRRSTLKHDRPFQKLTEGGESLFHKRNIVDV